MARVRHVDVVAQSFPMCIVQQVEKTKQLPSRLVSCWQLASFAAALSVCCATTLRHIFSD